MFKYVLIVGLFVGMGSQASAQSAELSGDLLRPAGLELIAVRVNKFMDTYDVVVQRAFMKKGDSASLKILAAPTVSGYPNKWRRSDPTAGISGYTSVSAYSINGEMVDIPVQPGVQLVAKVVPKHQNTVRVMGVFVMAEMTEHGMDETCVPFDVECEVGVFKEVFRRQTTIDPVTVPLPE